MTSRPTKHQFKAQNNALKTFEINFFFDSLFKRIFPNFKKLQSNILFKLTFLMWS